MIARWQVAAIAAMTALSMQCGDGCGVAELVGTYKVRDPPEPYLASAEMKFDGDQMTVTYIRNDLHFTVIYRLVDADYGDSGDSGDSAQ